MPPRRSRGISFDATCSLVALDRAGRPASVSTSDEARWNVVVWLDHRAIAEAQECTATGHRVLDFVGGTMSPEMEIPKLMWLKRHLPERWAALRPDPRSRRLFDLARLRLERALLLHGDLQVDLPRPRDAGLAGGFSGEGRARGPARAGGAAGRRKPDRRRRSGPCRRKPRKSSASPRPARSAAA